MKPDLSVNVAGIAMRNPIMTASGTFGYGEEFAPYMDLHSIGAMVTKGLSLQPRAGNPTPRIVETPAGMLNAIGLQNVGIDAFIAGKTPFLRTVDTPCIANFFGGTVEEYAEMARRLDAVPEVAALGERTMRPVVVVARKVDISDRELRTFGVEVAYAVGGGADLGSAELTRRAAGVASSWTW